MEAFQAFGLADRSVELGLEQVKVFPYAPDLWLATAELLLQRQDWNRLRQTAIAMRGESSLAGRMSAYSCYLDGQIDLSLRRDLMPQQTSRGSQNAQPQTPYWWRGWSQACVEPAVLRKPRHYCAGWKGLSEGLHFLV